MQFKVIRAKLLEGVKRVQGATAGKSLVQICNCIKLEAGEPGLRLTGTNLDTAATTGVEVVQLESGGATAVPAKLFSTVISALPEGELEVSMDAENSIMTVKGGSSVYRIKCMPSNDFPTFGQAEDWKPVVTIDSLRLRDTLRKIAYAQSKNETQKNLMCVNVKYDGSVLKWAATDSKRLSLVEMAPAADAQPSLEEAISIPSASVATLLPLLIGEDAVLSRSATLMKVSLQGGQTEFITKLTEGKYPPYERVIPSGDPASVVPIDRPALLDAVERVSVMASQTSPNVNIVIGDNQIIITSKSETGDAARDIVPVKYAGEKISATFYPQFIMELLRASDDDEILLQYFSPVNPYVFKSQGEKYLALVMPLRTVR